VRVDRRELGALRQEPELDLALEDAGADRLVPIVEDALVLVRPFERDEVGAWPACGARYMKKGLSGSMTLASRMNSMALSAMSSARW